MTSRFVRNSAFGIVAGLGNALSNLGSSVILARLLGVEGLGTVMFALWIVVLGSAVADLGSAAALSRYLPEFQARRQDSVIAHLTRRLFRPFAAVLLLIGFALAGYGLWCWYREPGTSFDALNHRPREHPAFWILTALALTLQALALFGYGYLRGIQRFGEIARITLIALGIQLLAVTAGSLVFGVLGALCGYCAGFLIPAVMALRHLGKAGTLDPTLARRVTRYAGFAWAGNLATAILYSRIEIFFIERSWGAGAVGLFAVGITLANIAAQGPMLLTSGFLPHFSESYGRGDRAAIQRIYESGTRMMSFLVFPACFGMAAILPSLVPLVYGAAFDGGITAAMILALSSASGALYIGNQLLLGCDRSDLGFATTLTAAVLLVLGCLTVIPGFGLIGAAVVRLGVQFVLICLTIWIIDKRLGFATPIGDMLRLFCAAALCGASAWLAVRALPKPANLAVAIPFGALVYGVAVRLLNALPAADVERLRGMVRPLPDVLSHPLDVALTLLAPRADAQVKL